MSAPDEDRLVDRVQMGIPKADWAVAVFSAVAAVLLGAALGRGADEYAHLGCHLQAREHSWGEGDHSMQRVSTLYWFVPDSKTKSTCYGTCAAHWPPVTGTPTASPGVTGTLGTINAIWRRGAGHLRRAAALHLCGRFRFRSSQGTGNGINLNGGLWYEMDASG